MTKRRNTIEDFWKLVDKSTDCWKWLGRVNDKGYGDFCYDGKVFRAHRLSWILTYGDIPYKKIICHKCDNPPCVNPEHLFVGTYKDNTQDALKKGRFNNKRYGQFNSFAKFKPEDIVRIRELAAAGKSHTAIAKEYGRARSQITDIINFKAWRSVGPMSPSPR